MNTSLDIAILLSACKITVHIAHALFFGLCANSHKMQHVGKILSHLGNLSFKSCVLAYTDCNTAPSTEVNDIRTSSKVTNYALRIVIT